jgi:hypothetical protein
VTLALWRHGGLPISGASLLRATLFRRLCGRGTSAPALRVVILDAAAVVRAGAPAATEAEFAAARRGDVILVLAGAEAEENRGDEEGGPRAPGETEGVTAEAGAAAGVLEGIAGLDEGDGHEHGGNRVEEEGSKGDEAGDGGAQTTAAGEEAGEEGQGLEEEGDDEEDPAEAPQVVVVVRGRVAAIAADKRARGFRRAAVPGLAEGGRGVRTAAVLVAVAAEVEVGPLRDGTGAGDAVGVGPEEVGFVEGRVAGDAREDDEPQEQEGAREEDEPDDAEGGVLEHSDVLGARMWPLQLRVAREEVEGRRAGQVNDVDRPQ